MVYYSIGMEQITIAVVIEVVLSAIIGWIGLYVLGWKKERSLDTVEMVIRQSLKGEQQK